MAKLNVNQNQLTESQLGCVLTEIAMSAKSITRLVVMLRDSDDERDDDALQQSIEGMAERIGFMADLTLHRQPGARGRHTARKHWIGCCLPCTTKLTAVACNPAGPMKS